MSEVWSAAKDSLHLSQLITTVNGVWRLLFPGEHVRQPFVEGCGFPSHPPSGGENERCEDPTLHVPDTLAISPFLDVKHQKARMVTATQYSFLCDADCTRYRFHSVLVVNHAALFVYSSFHE